MRICKPLGWWLAAFLCLPVMGADVALVQHGDAWHYRKGTSAPQANWATVPVASLDGSWLVGPGGFGYGDTIATEATGLTDMLGAYKTLYLRREFARPAGVDTNLHLQLTVDFDDGFVAYLNGVEIARSNAPGLAGVPVPFDGNATASREASCCSSPNPPAVLDLGLVGDRLVDGANLLAVQGLNQSSTSTDFHLIVDLALVDMTPPTNSWGGTLAGNTTWTAAQSPYRVIANLTVPAGVTLTIEPGVEVALGAGVGITVNGRLLAEGSESQRIRFQRAPGAGAWSRITLNNGAAESRFVWCDVDGAGGSGNITANNTRVLLDHVVFTNTLVQLVTLDDSSCIIQNCHFPSIQGNELLHFLRMPPGGYAVIASNLFGTPGIPVTTGYNDIIDFTGGNRPGPIAQFIGNTFLAAVDDCFDMDGTDAHIEGNVFLNVLQDAQRDSSSSPITTGEDNFGAGDTSQLVICRNFFFNCEHMLLLKDRGSAVVQNNTIVQLVTNASARTGSGAVIPPGIILYGEPWRGRPLGAGAIFEGNIAYTLDPAIRGNPFPLYDPASSFLAASRNLIQGTNWPGTGNLDADPLFVDPTGITYLNIRSNLALQPGSPCIGTGPNGLDMGAVVPAGATISGEPEGTTTTTSARLVVAGPGIFSYQWRLDGGPWSTEVYLTTNLLFTADMFAGAPPIVLTNLAPGTHQVEVVGRNSAGTLQSTPTRSRPWTVVTTGPLQITDAAWRDGTFVIEFPVTAGTGYTVQYREELGATGGWRNLQDVPAVTTNGVATVTDVPPSGAGARYYRIVTPMEP